MKVIILNKEEVGRLVGRQISDLVKASPKCVLGLPTGDSPVGIYKEMVKLANKEKINYGEVVTFNLDEYVGRYNNEDSYRYFMDTNLFDLININKENTFFPRFKNPEKYDELIAEHGGIDLQLVGVGNNGHIGFNEPGTSADSKTHVTYLTADTVLVNSRFFNDVSEVPNQAVTMGLSSIMRAKKIIFLAFGKAKAEAVKHLINATSYDNNWPLTILFNHPDLTIYIDEDAASLL